MAKVELKQPIVQEISDAINGAQSVVVVDYRGLTVAQDTELRKKLRAEGMKEISSIPGRDVLLGRLLGSMQSPIANLARVLNQIAENGGASSAAVETAAEEVAEAPVEAPAEETAETTAE